MLSLFMRLPLLLYVVDVDGVVDVGGVVGAADVAGVVGVALAMLKLTPRPYIVLALVMSSALLMVFMMMRLSRCC